MNKNIVFIIIISLVSAAGGVALFRSTLNQPEFISAGTHTDATPRKSTDTIKAATLNFNDIILKDLQSTPRHLSEWKSPILIVNFWAPWCPPCRREIPSLMDLQKTYQGDMQLIGLSFDTLQKVTEFNDKQPVNYPLLLVQSEATQINRYFGNDSRALPFTAVLNEQREIVFQYSGEISHEQLETQIKKLSPKSSVQSQKSKHNSKSKT